jgi:hypothetical protein
MQGVHPAPNATPTASEPSEPAGAGAQVRTQVAGEGRHAKHAEEQEPERDHQHAPDTVDPGKGAGDHRAGRGGHEAHGHEDRREAHHEKRRVEEGTATHLGRGAVAQLLERHAGDEREVAGHHRQNAGREERDEAGRECERKRNLNVDFQHDGPVTAAR